MSTKSDASPNIARPDVHAIVVNHWNVGGPEEQLAAAEAIVADWQHKPWPETLMSFNCFVSPDAATVLTYAQWASTDAEHQFMVAYGPAGGPAVERSVPGVETSDPEIYRLYRSLTADDTSQPPGCFVLVSIAADANAERAGQWIDAVCEAINTEPEPIPGLLAAHFHINITATKIINYAQWTSEAAHRRAMQSGDIEGIGQTDSPQWQRVMAMPQTTPIGLEYYHLHAALAPPS